MSKIDESIATAAPTSEQAAPDSNVPTETKPPLPLPEPKPSPSSDPPPDYETSITTIERG